MNRHNLYMWVSFRSAPTCLTPTKYRIGRFSSAVRDRLGRFRHRQCESDHQQNAKYESAVGGGGLIAVQLIAGRVRIVSELLRVPSASADGVELVGIDNPTLWLVKSAGAFLVKTGSLMLGLWPEQKSGSQLCRSIQSDYLSETCYCHCECGISQIIE